MLRLRRVPFATVRRLSPTEGRSRGGGSGAGWGQGGPEGLGGREGAPPGSEAWICPFAALATGRPELRMTWEGLPVSGRVGLLLPQDDPLPKVISGTQKRWVQREAV